MPPRSRLALIGLTILSLVIFAQVHSLTGETSPVSDDQRQILFSSTQDSIWHIFQPESFGMFRPTKSLFFYLVLKNNGSFQNFQVLGLVLAFISFAATWLFLWRTFDNHWSAFFGASIWLWHPSNTAIFNWASAMNIAVYYTCSLLAVLALQEFVSAKHERLRPIYLLMACVFLLGALFSYEMALTLPFLAVIYILIIGQRPEGIKRLLHGSSAMLCFTLVFFAFRQFLLSGATGSAPDNNLIGPATNCELVLCASVSYFEHLRFFIWPFSGFDFLISYTPRDLLPIAVALWIACIIMLLCSLKLFWKFPHLLFSLLWTAFSLATILNVIPVRAGPFCEYYVSLSNLGLVVLTLGLWQMLPSGKTHALKVSLAAILLIGLAIETTSRQPNWANQRALMEAAVDGGGRSHLAHASLSSIELQDGKTDEAFRLIRQAVDLAPWYDRNYALMTQIMMLSGVPRESLNELLNDLLRSFPESSSIHRVAAETQAKLEDPRAESTFLQAIELSREISELRNAHIAYGIFLTQASRAEEALSQFEAAKAYPPVPKTLAMHIEQTRKKLGKK